MAANLGGEDDDGIVDINITPFVDIVLVVLIIFMVATKYIDQPPSIKVDLPDAASGEKTESSSLGLTLTSDGKLFLDGVETTEGDLRTFIRAERARVDEVVCLIAADKDVEHGRVIWLIDLVKTEGVAKFAINIDKANLIAPSNLGGVSPGGEGG